MTFTGSRASSRRAPTSSPSGARGAVLKDEDEIPESVEIEINGILDLHYFHPKDLRTLIPDYIDECHKRGIFSLRIIHGKGIGAVRDSVHALLKRNQRVLSFKLAEPMAGGWGATLVELKP